MPADADSRTLDVTAFFENTGFTRFHVWILIVSSFVTFFDGLDFALISVVLPYLRDDLGLNAAMMGWVTSAAFAGQMIGSLFGSYLADIFGRRPVIIWCTIAGAAFTFVTGFAGSAQMIIVLRLLGGLAIGGLLAPAWSLNIETMPSGKKATAVTIIMLGFSIGGSLAGQVTNFVAPTYGWQAVFWVCGAGTMALALILLFTLPESVRWMVAMRKPLAKVGKALSKFDPAVGAVLRVHRRVAPGPPHAVDVDGQGHELAGSEAAPLPGRAQGQRHRVTGRTPHLGDLGAQLAHREHRVDQLEVAVDAVRGGQRFDQTQWGAQ